MQADLHLFPDSQNEEHWQLPKSGQLNSLPDTPLLQRQAQRESHVRSYPRRIPIAITQAQGARVRDEHNQTYLDCLAGAGVFALGHSHPEVVEALHKALSSQIPFQTLDITTPAKDAMMDQLLEFMPANFRNTAKLQFCGPAGADAVEAAIKLAKIATGRTSVISFQGGYHGMTHGALSLTSNLAAKSSINGLMPDVHFLPYPYPFRSPFGSREGDDIKQSLHYFHNMISNPHSGISKPAAVIVEPVQGEGGVIVAPPKWLKGIRDICTEFDIPLIVDEIQTGFGRTGKPFAFEHADITPDIVLLSKALGGGLPLAMIAFNEKLDKWNPGGHSGTFRGNQLAMISGCKTLEIIQRENLCDRAKTLGDSLKLQLDDLQTRHPQIGQVRGSGLMIGMEMVFADDQKDNLGNPVPDSTYAKAVQHEALKRGLICELGGHESAVLRLLPPLVISDEEAAFIVRVLDESMIAARA